MLSDAALAMLREIAMHDGAVWHDARKVALIKGLAVTGCLHDVYEMPDGGMTAHISPFGRDQLELQEPA